MRNKTFDESVKAYYQEQMLSSNTLARLKAMHEIEHKQQTFKAQNHVFWQWGKYLSVAASLLVVIMFYVEPMSHGLSPVQLMDSVVKEVQLNHQKRLAIEFQSNNYNQLGQVMIKLDFSIKAPRYIHNTDYTLLGSRYCSIQGHIAAQLKLQDYKGRAVTLYITQLNDDLAQLQHKKRNDQGLVVETWSEGDLFYSLAYPQ